MNKLLRTTFLTLLLAAVNVVMAETYTYTFTSKVFSGNGAKTLGDVSWTLDNDGNYYGYDGTKGQQIGSSNNPASFVTLTTDGITGEIMKITVNASTASGGSCTLTVKVGGVPFKYESSQTAVSLTTSATDYIFEGSSTGTIEIKITQSTSKAIFIKSLGVEHTLDVVQRECGLSYSDDECTAKIGANNTFPTLKNPNNLKDITYSSSNTVVASVTEKGKVYLNSVGTATITASFAGSALYYPGTASYKLTVDAADLPQPGGEAFVKVSDASSLSDGDIIILVNESAGKAMSTTQNNNNRGATSVTITNERIIPEENVQQITLEAGDGAWYLKVDDNKYLCAASNSSNYLKSGAKSDNSKADITYNKGDFDIKFRGYDRNWIRYNSGNDIFSCYGADNQQKPTQIYRLEGPMTVVTSKQELAAVEDDTEVYFVIADGKDARLLYGTTGEAYIRDNTGAFALIGVESNVPFASNQHIAGYIKGKKTSQDGMIVLEATNKTNTAFLAIAAPVTEEDVEPVAVDDATNLSSYYADWVTMEAVRNGDVRFENRFDLTTSDGFAGIYAYDRVLADVSAIARPEALCPVNVNEVTPFIFVIDEAQEFVSPPEDFSNVKVRLVRTIGDYWNTLCLPFNPGIDGQIREYTSFQGNKMIFSEVKGDMVPGKPYLVWPSEPLTNPVFESVTLSGMTAQTVTVDNHSFVGTYSPYEMALDKTERFLGADDNLHYPESDQDNANKLRGMRAFFRVPAESGANIDFTGSDGISQMETETQADDVWYTLSGIRVNKPQHGVYIKNGKKLVVK